MYSSPDVYITAFIPDKVSELTLESLGVKWEYTLNGTPVKRRASCTQAF